MRASVQAAARPRASPSTDSFFGRQSAGYVAASPWRFTCATARLKTLIKTRSFL